MPSEKVNEYSVNPHIGEGTYRKDELEELPHFRWQNTSTPEML
jgi:hypothetical protein